MVGLTSPQKFNAQDKGPSFGGGDISNIPSQPIRVGIFGGTFDPPHIGHLVLAEIARHDLELDQVLWVLTEHPPHKKNETITSLRHRLAMLQAAIHDNPNFEISRVDIDRPGPHYAVDTVDIIGKDNPEAIIVYLMGSDSLLDLPYWYCPERLIELIDELGVMVRPGSETMRLEPLFEKTEVLGGLVGKIRYLAAPRLDIASSYIRRLIVERGPYRYYLPEKVYQFIQEHKLYSAGDGEQSRS